MGYTTSMLLPGSKAGPSKSALNLMDWLQLKLTSRPTSCSSGSKNCIVSKCDRVMVVLAPAPEGRFQGDGSKEKRSVCRHWYGLVRLERQSGTRLERTGSQKRLSTGLFVEPPSAPLGTEIVIRFELNTSDLSPAVSTGWVIEWN